MEDKALELQITQLALDLGRIEGKADVALKAAQEAREITVKTEERMKSIQHRLDAQEMRLSEILSDTRKLGDQLNNVQLSLDGNTKLTKGISSGMKALVSILGFFTALLSIVKLIFI